MFRIKSKSSTVLSVHIKKNNEWKQAFLKPYGVETTEELSSQLKNLERLNVIKIKKMNKKLEDKKIKKESQSTLSPLQKKEENIEDIKDTPKIKEEPKQNTKEGNSKKN